jgi:arylsulfatase A-like enzyme
MPRSVPRVAIAAVAAIIVIACGLMSIAADSGTRPNVLLITIDTLRADRIGAYGFVAAQTATMDRLADEGVLFEEAYSAAPITMPSHSTIMTGLLPPEHGATTALTRCRTRP